MNVPREGGRTIPDVEVITLIVAVLTLISTIGIGFYQLKMVSVSMQVDAVTTILSMIDSSLDRMVDCDPAKAEEYTEPLMNAFDLYALLVSKKLIKRSDLRKYMEDSFPKACENAIRILTEDEFKKRYQNAYALYEELKDRPRKKRLSFLMKFEVFSKRYLLPVPISRFQDTHRRAASLHSMVLMPAASEFVMFLLA